MLVINLQPPESNSFWLDTQTAYKIFASMQIAPKSYESQNILVY
jgi:hypothetical protein